MLDFLFNKEADNYADYFGVKKDTDAGKFL
jgi:hypothetical protein